MDQTKHDRECMDGRLPARAPLANPYVPFQEENPPKYDARKALVRGTLYPGLDLPFMGMVNKTEKPESPMIDLQTLGFALLELALYLDTHRDDKEALDLYRTYQQMYHEGMMKYSEKHGQMSHGMPTTHGEYAWLDDPWPWEYSKN